MSQPDDENPVRIDDDPALDEPASGTATGEPTAGAEQDEAEHEQAVEPDDNAFEVDGPQAGHA